MMETTVEGLGSVLWTLSPHEHIPAMRPELSLEESASYLIPLLSIQFTQQAGLVNIRQIKHIKHIQTAHALSINSGMIPSVLQI
jgi:hypothetical protein